MIRSIFRKQAVVARPAAKVLDLVLVRSSEQFATYIFFTALTIAEHTYAGRDNRYPKSTKWSGNIGDTAINAASGFRLAFDAMQNSFTSWAILQ